MFGYWLVIAIMVCALVAVVVATTADAPPATTADAPGTARSPIWAALGASDATGEGTPDPARDNWVAQVAATLPAKIVVHNLGQGGSTLAEARRHQVPAALALRPTLVTAWLVVNDLASGVPLPTYERELDAFLTELATTGAQLIVGNVPDLALVPALANGPADAASLRLAAEHWNATIARLAAARGAEIVDLFAEPAATEDFGPDGFHPSPVGHRRLAARFRPAVERALAIGSSTDDERPVQKDRATNTDDVGTLPTTGA